MCCRSKSWTDCDYKCINSCLQVCPMPTHQHDPLAHPAQAAEAGKSARSYVNYPNINYKNLQIQLLLFCSVFTTSLFLKLFWILPKKLVSILKIMLNMWGKSRTLFCTMKENHICGCGEMAKIQSLGSRKTQINQQEWGTELYRELKQVSDVHMLQRETFSEQTTAPKTDEQLGNLYSMIYRN